MSGPPDDVTADEGDGAERPGDAELLARLGAALAPEAVAPPSPERIAAVRALAARAGARTVPADQRGPRRRDRRRLLVGGVAAGFGLVVGAGAGRATAPDVPAGPPTEPLQLDGVPEGVEAAARLVNHTWGVELLLDVAHLTTGVVYDVAYTATSGERLPAGSFVAVPDVLMVCRFNAALLRADTAAVEVAGRGDGVRMTARLV